MALFKPARNESAFLKLGLMGAAGSGKTYTAARVARGVVELAREKGLAYASKPVMFIDSENGSDYVLDVFEEAGIELLVAKTKSFRDLCDAMKEAEAHASFLIIDSVSAFWEEWKTTYQKTKKRSRLQFDDFAAIKSAWREGFTDPFINSKLHIAMCGRLAFEYDYTVDDETGKKNLEKTDVKMAAEKELGYETSLYVLMERDTNLQTMQMVRNATVLKDRFRTLDGKTFPNPSFQTFAPHILKLNLSGEHHGVDLTRSSADMVPIDGKRENYSLRRKIVVDEIEALLAENGLGGQTADAKTKRAALIKEHFKCTSRTEIEELMPLVDLQANYDSLHRALTGQASRYGVPDAPAPVEDEIMFTGADTATPVATDAAPTAAVQAPAELPPPPSGSTSVDETEDVDPREAIADGIVEALGKAANSTQLAAVMKVNSKARKALTDEQGKRVDDAFADRGRVLKERALSLMSA